MKDAYNWLNSYINSDDNVVAAISGGPDSMALLYLLINLRKEKDFNIICAHVNHNVREESIIEAKFVEEYCQTNNVIFETMKIDSYEDDNFENEARNKRYDYFSVLLKKYNSKYLLTAHHGDDLMETILMRIVRGSSLRGYAGFDRVVNKEDYTILRPFICLTKDELIKYNEENDIKYFIDATNLTDIHTRNRYRKYVLPFLKSEDKDVHLKFLKFSQLLISYSDYIDKTISMIMPNLFEANKLEIIKFNGLDEIIKFRVINYILEGIYNDDLMLITDRHTQLILNLINSNKANTSIILPNNIIVRKEYNIVYFNDNSSNIPLYEVELIDYVSLPNNKCIKKIDSFDKNGNDICRLNCNDVTLPLHVRNRCDGDRMYVKGMSGSRKINDIFIDLKIPMNQRDAWPVVIDSTGQIVWLPGLKKSKFDIEKNKNCDIILRYY